MRKVSIVICFLIGISFIHGFSQQTVKATYYANKFQGRKTSSGEKYNKDSFTCAHRTYPFGTIVKVTNPKNSKSVYVRVNDRGPFTKGRSIDLSHAAAKAIGIYGQGIATVEIKRMDSSFKQKDKEFSTLQIDSITNNEMQRDSIERTINDSIQIKTDTIK